MPSCRRSFVTKEGLMKTSTIAFAFAVFASAFAAQAEDLNGWRTSPAGRCIMDRGDSNVAKFAAVDANCGPVSDSTRAARAFVLSNDFETVIKAIRLGDQDGVKTLMTAL